MKADEVKQGYLLLHESHLCGDLELIQVEMQYKSDDKCRLIMLYKRNPNETLGIEFFRLKQVQEFVDNMILKETP